MDIELGLQLSHERGLPRDILVCGPIHFISKSNIYFSEKAGGYFFARYIETAGIVFLLIKNKGSNCIQCFVP